MRRNDLIIQLLKDLPGDVKVYVRHPEAGVECEIKGVEFDQSSFKYVIVTK